MIDLDILHSVLQSPVATIELTVALALAMRWHGARGREVLVEPSVTATLAVFIGLIGLKQAFWGVWGALQARDLFHVSEQVRTHWIPIVFNAAISIVGLVLLTRLSSIVFGRMAYAATSVAALSALALCAFLLGRG